MASKAHRFFFEHKIFTVEQFAQAMKNPLPTCRIMLNQHLKSGNIVRIKQGLYAAIPSGANPNNYPINPYTIISQLAPDALIAYHTALQFYGLAYSHHFQYLFQSTMKIRSFQFRQDRFKVTQYSKCLPQNKHSILTKNIDYEGFNIRVPQLERTIVDCLDRINLSGGLEEVWRSLKTIDSINLEALIEYLFLINKATTIAKVGFLLRTQQKKWDIQEIYLNKLKKRLPRSAHYLDRSYRKNGHYVSEWRLIVPQELIKETWEEPMYGEDS